MLAPYRRLVLTVCACALLHPGTAVCQDDEFEAPPSPLPVIADEPRTIDPARFVPEKLSAKVQADFSSSSLREVVEWLKTDRELAVLVEKSALNDMGVLMSDPVSDRLDDDPVYLLLNRLSSLGLAWYYTDDILHITTEALAAEQLSTQPYVIGDLLDAEYLTDDINNVIQTSIAPESWEDVGGAGVVRFLGDVMFVRQTGELHRRVQGTLAALRSNGRQTFVLDPPKHLALREKLSENVNADFEDTPLIDAVAKLAADANVDIRLDAPALRSLRVRDREPVTLKLTDRKLKTVLQSMVLDLKLTWILRDGVLWITSAEQAEGFLKSAIYDVRDLCRDEDESEGLKEAVVSQSAEHWEDSGGPGSMSFARPGILVVHTTERVHMDVLELLETYRRALRNSKIRDRDAVDPREITTVYYRMHADVADGLQLILPKLVEPASWRGIENVDAAGEIILAPSNPELVQPIGKDGKPEGAMTDRAVLIIKQSREIHDKIAAVIRRVEIGDQPAGMGMGGMGGMGGGFGGGFFAVPQKRPERLKK
ncbi:MAG: hypothetical protein QGG36_16680 [Pirellulaceae bacterium]|jgi:hypothetical protein|nr:hypothetical protein [Pirellulaceae bacterium]MDP7017443.1 hypothetical protein [Pirellulaceae bacterium]